MYTVVTIQVFLVDSSAAQLVEHSKLNRGTRCFFSMLFPAIDLFTESEEPSTEYINFNTQFISKGDLKNHRLVKWNEKTGPNLNIQKYFVSCRIFTK